MTDEIRKLYKKAEHRLLSPAEIAAGALPLSTYYLWGQPDTFHPYLVERSFGDGKCYLALSPFHLRPKFYVVRVGSEWIPADPMDLDAPDPPDLTDCLDEIWDAIEEEYPHGCDEFAETGECECCKHSIWPEAATYEGSSWRVMDDEELQELGLLK